MKNFTLIEGVNFNKIRKDIKEAKDANLHSDLNIIFSSNDDELNRKILEKEKIDILLLNQSGRKDFLKQRNSGFNHVLAKMAKKNNVSIGINFDEIVNSHGINKSKIFGRIRQNIKICNKNKLKMKFIIQNSENQRDIYDLKSLGAVLGMPTWIVRDLT